MHARVAGTISAIVPALLLSFAVAGAAATTPTRAQQEAAFLDSVNQTATANTITGDLPGYVGKHVEYTCGVETVVRPGLIIGQCGLEAEPVDLFVKMPSTAGLKQGQRLHILAVVEQPAQWSDITGHTVYYAFIRAVYVDKLPGYESP